MSAHISGVQKEDVPVQAAVCLRAQQWHCNLISTCPAAKRRFVMDLMRPKLGEDANVCDTVC